MSGRLLQYAPADFARVLQGIPVALPGQDVPDEVDNARMFAIASFIYAALDSRSVEWSDYTSASSAYLAATATSHSLESPDAHIPSYIRADERSQNGIAHSRLAAAVKAALPSVADVRARPSSTLPEMGVWSCSESDCGHVIDPWDLTVAECEIIGSYMGVGADSGIVVRADGGAELNRQNPWQVMRCIDCLGWSHFAWHLNAHCIVFWWPDPTRAYKSEPGLWWNEERLCTHQAHRQLREQLEADELADQQNIRKWKCKMALTHAKKGLHAVRFHLTKWRRDAMLARETLVREMFQAGRSIVDTGLALVHRMDVERTNTDRVRLQEERERHKEMMREWTSRRERWSQM
ncbi:unnamed protein product [Peniophora sp. CBMAI 1063]|nr:unnamed protein product [Peniophora sp. CBMAI 1063]